jgi:hypothetical protein
MQTQSCVQKCTVILRFKHLRHVFIRDFGVFKFTCVLLISRLLRQRREKFLINKSSGLPLCEINKYI